MNETEKLMDAMISYAIQNPDKAPKRVLVISLTKTNIEKILTPARTEILRVIIKRKPKTVGNLVKILERPKESVSRDLKVLAKFGLLTLIRYGREKFPKVEKDIIALSLA